MIGFPIVSLRKGFATNPFGVETDFLIPFPFKLVEILSPPFFVTSFPFSFPSLSVGEIGLLDSGSGSSE